MGDWIINDIDPYRMHADHFIKEKTKVKSKFLIIFFWLKSYTSLNWHRLADKEVFEVHDNCTYTCTILLKYLLGYIYIYSMYFSINSNFIHTHSKMAMCFKCS